MHNKKRHLVVDPNTIPSTLVGHYHHHTQLAQQIIDRIDHELHHVHHDEDQDYHDEDQDYDDEDQVYDDEDQVYDDD